MTINAPGQPSRPGMEQMMNDAADIVMSEIYTLARYRPAGAPISGPSAITPEIVRVQISTKPPPRLGGSVGQRVGWSGAPGVNGVAASTRPGARVIWVTLAQWPMGFARPNPIPAAGAATPPAPRNTLGARVLELKPGDELYVSGAELGKNEPTVCVTIARILAADQAIVFAEAVV